MGIRDILFSFEGRLGRGAFWAWLLAANSLLAITFLLIFPVGISQAFYSSIGVLLLLFWPSLAIQAKRWHDRDKSGWWILIGLIPILGPIWVLVENGLLPGTYGENQFGLPNQKPLPGWAGVMIGLGMGIAVALVFYIDNRLSREASRIMQTSQADTGQADLNRWCLDRAEWAHGLGVKLAAQDVGRETIGPAIVDHWRRQNSSNSAVDTSSYLYKRQLEAITRTVVSLWPRTEKHRYLSSAQKADYFSDGSRILDAAGACKYGWHYLDKYLED